MNLTIRQANFPDDAPSIVRVLNAESMGWLMTPEELEHQETTPDPEFHRMMLVAEDASLNEERIVGIASAEHEPAAHQEGKFKVDVCVHPDARGCGIGSRLYDALMSHFDSIMPRELQAVTREENAPAIRFAARRGFVELWRRINFRLDVSHFDFAPYSGLGEHINALGLEVKTYVELEGDPTRLEKLYALDWALYQDVPFGNVITKMSREEFEKEWTGNPGFIPEACFIVMAADQFVGYSNLMRSGSNDYWWIVMTGVLPEYRGNGVGTLLRLYDIRYARDHDASEIHTVNDSGNANMIALNMKMGFEREGTTIRFVKRMAHTA